MEIMKTSRLRNKFFNLKSGQDRKAYSKQRNFCVSLIRQKKRFFSIINIRYVNDNKTFLEIVKPVFAESIRSKSKISFIEKSFYLETIKNKKEVVISEHKPVAKVFNEYFCNMALNLKTPQNDDFEIEFIETNGPVLNAIKNLKIIQVS